MRCFRSALTEFLRREDGPTAVEYGVMMAFILVVCFAAVTTVGTNTNKTYTKVNNTISSSS
jgi:pilus assembly protein Flp/PilA